MKLQKTRELKAVIVEEVRMRRRPVTRPVPLFPNFPWQQPGLCGTPRSTVPGQTVGPKDLCFDCDFPFGGDKLVMWRGASPSTGLPVKPVCMGVAPVGCFRPGGRAEGLELPGPGPRQAVWVKTRGVSFGP